jgi:DNA-binding NarL/FixJ family response regulator
MPKEVMMMADDVRVLVVDDQAPFRRAARAVCSVTPGFEVVGDAESGEDAVVAARVLQPDLVLMDVRLPGIDGIEATAKILTDEPDVSVILLSTYQESDLPSGWPSCGALGFVNKDELGPDVLRELWENRTAA